MTPRAYCGDACREVTRYDPSGSLTRGMLHREVRPSERTHFLRAARCIRADRVRLARIGACIGCGQTPAERASELAATGGVR